MTRHHNPTARTHVLLAGGGSGGHVFPALAVAEALAQRGVEVSFAGSAAGMEAGLVAARGVRFHPVEAKAWVGRGPLARVATVATLVRSSLAARQLVRREGVAVTLGTGGYVSVPTMLGTRLAQRPTVLLEPNAAAGTANRMLSRFATGACVPAGAQPHLACPLWETGVPVREAFAAAAGPLPDGPIRILVLGGSQGSVELNAEVPLAIAAADPAHQVEVLHQAGRGRREAAGLRWQATAHPAEVVEFVDDVATAMRASHLVISRAGAITLAELAAVGRGALLVPLAAAGDHQRHNAESFARHGAGVAVAGGVGLAARLQLELERLLHDRMLLETMHQAARAHHRGDAAGAIADRLLAVAGGRAA